MLKNTVIALLAALAVSFTLIHNVAAEQPADFGPAQKAKPVLTSNEVYETVDFIAPACAAATTSYKKASKRVNDAIDKLVNFEKLVVLQGIWLNNAQSLAEDEAVKLGNDEETFADVWDAMRDVLDDLFGNDGNTGFNQSLAKQAIKKIRKDMPVLNRNFGYAAFRVCNACKGTPYIMEQDGLNCFPMLESLPTEESEE